jgi:hypothetical protein
MEGAEGQYRDTAYDLTRILPRKQVRIILCVPMAKTYDLPFMLTNCSNNYG